MEKEYYYLKNGMKQGPFTLDALKKEPINPDTQFAGKILYKASDLEKILEKNYKGGGK